MFFKNQNRRYNSANCFSTQKKTSANLRGANNKQENFEDLLSFNVTKSSFYCLYSPMLSSPLLSAQKTFSRRPSFNTHHHRPPQSLNQGSTTNRFVMSFTATPTRSRHLEVPIVCHFFPAGGDVRRSPDEDGIRNEKSSNPSNCDLTQLNFRSRPRNRWSALGVESGCEEDRERERERREMKSSVKSFIFFLFGKFVFFLISDWDSLI